MSEKFVTKRAHKKSRAGCQRCTSRKVKVYPARQSTTFHPADLDQCDETQPSCTYCSSRKLPCHYPQTQRHIEPDFTAPAISGELVTRSRAPPPRSDWRDKESFQPWGLEINPSPPILSAVGSYSTEDLRLIHHWSFYHQQPQCWRTSRHTPSFANKGVTTCFKTNF
jgi:hypothetical protein